MHFLRYPYFTNFKNLNIFYSFYSRYRLILCVKYYKRSMCLNATTHKCNNDFVPKILTQEFIYRIKKTEFNMKTWNILLHVKRFMWENLKFQYTLYIFELLQHSFNEENNPEIQTKISLFWCCFLRG